MVHQTARSLTCRHYARSISRNRKLSYCPATLRREKIYRVRERRDLSHGSAATPFFVGEAVCFPRESCSRPALSGRRFAKTRRQSAVATAAFRLSVANWMKISQAISPNFPVAAGPDQKCAPRAVWPLYSLRRTFPGGHRDCRCNAAPSLRAFWDRRANQAASPPGGRQSNAKAGGGH